MAVIDRHVGLPLYPTGTRPKGDGIVLSSFSGGWVVEFPVNGLCHGLTDGNGHLA